MAQLDMLNINGEKVGTVELREDIFGIEPNADLLFRYVDMQLANKRSGTASTKTRAEVRGGGRKPWAQKHLGRARAGSTRSPIFRHGGVTFGPKPRSYEKKLNKKMKRLALKSALSVRVSENNLMVLEDIKFDAPKTKTMKDIIKKIGVENKKTLFVLPKKSEEYKNVKLSARNLPKVKVLIADNPSQEKTNIDGLNVFDLINNEKVVITKAVVAKIEEVLG
ncbi:50S ribosomal protein L4 [Tepiditoga spiralis]|uniref:Large ribosomal subunit protein uL4 n=1 Tax=Tepiditoga spiralis TaxID=2108365 RepID=A0A7G1G7I9_9BACT|nr:50S ribosomal protein L4 [Tepiditoga spiralis]BBE30897.1 50S ribosomal protein L4 [Tepiditoga spiralis]